MQIERNTLQIKKVTDEKMYFLAFETLLEGGARQGLLNELRFHYSFFTKSKQCLLNISFILVLCEIYVCEGSRDSIGQRDGTEAEKSAL